MTEEQLTILIAAIWAYADGGNGSPKVAMSEAREFIKACREADPGFCTCAELDTELLAQGAKCGVCEKKGAGP